MSPSVNMESKAEPSYWEYSVSNIVTRVSGTMQCTGATVSSSRGGDPWQLLLIQHKLLQLSQLQESSSRSFRTNIRNRVENWSRRRWFYFTILGLNQHPLPAIILHPGLCPDERTPAWNIFSCANSSAPIKNFITAHKGSKSWVSPPHKTKLNPEHFHQSAVTAASSWNTNWWELSANLKYF